MKSKIMYIENKSGENSLTGIARIGRITFSKSKKSINYAGKTFQSLKGKGFKANYFDIETGDHYWISGCKKDGSDNLYGHKDKFVIDDDVKEEYLKNIRGFVEKQKI